MSEDRRVVLVESDPEARRRISNAFTAAGLEVLEFADVRAALDGLDDARPALIVASASDEPVGGEPFIEVARRSWAQVVPWIALAAGGGPEAALASLAAGADEVAAAPLDVELLAAKALALLRMAGRITSSRQRGRPLTGTVGPSGTLGLVKFCENHRLTGRLMVDTGEMKRWIAFQRGELIEAGVTPEADEDDPLGALLSLRHGTYVIERTGDEDGERPVAGSNAGRDGIAAEPAPPLPGGRLSAVEAAGASFEVQTEAANRPNFTVTTIVSRRGRVVRKTETSWQHPLRRGGDHDLARSQIDRQHDGLVLRIREMAVELGRRRARRAALHGPLLAWAMYFIVEQVWSHLGTLTTQSLLRRTHEKLADRYHALRVFRVGADARIELDHAHGPFPPRGFVEAVAEWAVAFLEQAGKVADEAGAIPIRQATVLMEPALEQAGFYRAVDAARAPAQS